MSDAPLPMLRIESGRSLVVDPPDDRLRTSSRIRGTVAVRIVGELITRLVAGESWEFAAFGRDDNLIISGSSSQTPPDLAALRAEIRLQRIAASPLPHVSMPLASADARRSICAVFGEFGVRVAVLRVVRSAVQKAYAAREGASIEQFFRQHADAISASIFDAKADDTAGSLAVRRAAPIAFVIDQKGLLLSANDEPEGPPSDLRSHLMPRNGEVPPVLRPVLSELLERQRSGAGESELTAVLPFAIVRLTPMRLRGAAPGFLVSVEWLRSRASLEATAAQFAISKRELQVLSAMLRGAPVAEIAAELSISESTVVFHLKRMLKKTLSKNRTELAARMLGWQISAVG